MSNQYSGILKNFKIESTFVLFCVLIGVITNIINGAISPYYFRITMHWFNTEIRLKCIVQGIYEGILYGIFFATIFSVSFSLITKDKANYAFAFKHIIRVAIIVLCCWTIGGLLAVMLVRLSPEFYRSHFPWTPTGVVEQMKYAWVGGSIWGEIIGGLLGTVVGLVSVKNNWNNKSSTTI